MKKYNGFEAKRTTQRELLPAGGYVAKIMGAEEFTYNWGSVLVISFDIAEGEHSGFFAADYRGQTAEDKKWRGTYRLNEPTDDGSEKDEWSKRSFNNAVASIEESNPGYHWNWEPMERGDFSQLKGKTVGVLFRNREYAFDDNNGKHVTGWTTECCALTAAEDVRQNKFRMPKDKPLNGSSAQPKPTYENVSDVLDDDDLPFD